MTFNSNQLHLSTSPYLKQHADNPVHWQLWETRVLAHAQEKKLPILLSIGYSACHWCHVMAHESFEDPATADIMNRLFVNIKVDREERPDLDKIYQLSHQLLTGRGGGWPLTVFIDPVDLTAFFAGTYFPPAPRHGLPAFAELLQRVAAYFSQETDDIQRQNTSLRETIADLQSNPNAQPKLNQNIVEDHLQHIQGQYDQHYGGFGHNTKFPQATSLEWLAKARTDTVDTQKMLQHSLYHIARLGLYDHVGGGFFRYCVDPAWEIPHFEKMLYDNALLLPLFAEAAARYNSPLFQSVCEQTTSWIRRRLAHPEGAYYSSLDADNQQGEGDYYVWRKTELQQQIDPQIWADFAATYKLDQAANFETHSWHLLHHEVRHLDEIGYPATFQDNQLFNPVWANLLNVRQQRPAPGLDNKILTAWNALLVSGWSRAGRALQQSEYIDHAEQCLTFIYRRVWKNPTLHAVYAGQQARQPGFLDDYAFTLQACLDLLQARWRIDWFTFAIDLAEQLLQQFYDQQHGAFWFTTDDAESRLPRLKPLYDEALPSGNAVAIKALQQLGHLSGESRYLEAAANSLQAASTTLQRVSIAHAGLMIALQDHLSPPVQIILCLGGDDPTDWETFLTKHPNFCCYTVNSKDTLPEMMQNLYQFHAHTTAYVCAGTQCYPPLSSVAQLRELIETLN